MILSSYYNSVSDCLVLSVNSKNKPSEIKVVDNMTKLYDEEGNLYAINVFDPEIKKAGYIDIEMLDQNLIKEFGSDVSSPFIYGRIESIEKHPKSEKLNICQVNLGNSVTQIVCGAKNVEINKLAIVAQIGAIMPNSLYIAPSKLINVDSNGMMCSLRELGFVQDFDGIMLFDDGSHEVGSIVKRSDLE